MKNLLYIISLCGLLTACDLQEEPYGFYSDDNFYKSDHISLVHIVISFCSDLFEIFNSNRKL